MALAGRGQSSLTNLFSALMLVSVSGCDLADPMHPGSAFSAAGPVKTIGMRRSAESICSMVPNSSAPGLSMLSRTNAGASLREIFRACRRLHAAVTSYPSAQLRLFTDHQQHKRSRSYTTLRLFCRVSGRHFFVFGSREKDLLCLRIECHCFCTWLSCDCSGILILVG